METANRNMSDTNLTKMFGEEILTCSICLERFKQPKVLPCLHTYCQNCIQRHFDVYKLVNKDRLSCPSCRELIPMPSSGVKGFQDDITVPQIAALLEKLDKLSKDVDDGAVGACAIPDVTEQKRELQSSFEAMENTVGKIRCKILQVYHVESHIRYKMEHQLKSASTNLSARCPKSVAEVEAEHGPALAQLADEQMRLYTCLAELKCGYDTLEYILHEAEPAEIEAMYDELRKLIVRVEPYLIYNSSSSTPEHKPKGGANQDFPALSHINLKELNVDFGVGQLLKGKDMKRKSTLDLRKHSKKDKLSPRLIYKVSGFGKNPGQFDFPTHASFLPDGSVVVADKNNHRLQFFNQEGKFVRITSQDRMKPRRVKLNPHNGLLYVSDEMGECVKVFTIDGKMVQCIGEKTFQCPAGIDFDSKGNVLMTDAENCFVTVHTKEGVELTKFYVRGITDLTIPMPYFATVNEDDQLIVSDQRNNCVKIYSNKGKQLSKITKLVCPRGICMDPYGNILIAESDKHRVSMYNPYGKLVQYVLTKEDGLCFPMGLDMNQSGQLVITQCGPYTAHEVLVFQVY